MQSKSILISTFGSLGDLFPYLAMAAGLQRRGHRVAIASSMCHRARIERAGMTFHLTAPHCDFSDPVFQRRALEELSGGRFVLRDTIFPQIRASYNDLLKATEGADLLVTQMLSFAGPLIAEMTGIPWISTVLAPSAFLSDTDSPVLASRLRWIREHLPALNGFVNRAARYTTRTWAEPVHYLRQELGLPRSADPIFEGQHSPLRVLALFSSVFAEPQPDWPPQVLVTGFPFWEDAPVTAEVASVLDDFLQAGPAPLVFTLGSSAVLDPGTFYRESATAARKLGCRAVLIGYPREAAISSQAGLLTLPYAPHTHVFRRACAVVHPGGIGTTATALRSGCPMLVVPWAYDQPDNAARLVRLGVARTLSRSAYSARRAASELDRLLTDSQYRRHCASIAHQVQSEDGVEAACTALEGCLRPEGCLATGK